MWSLHRIGLDDRRRRCAVAPVAPATGALPPPNTSPTGLLLRGGFDQRGSPTATASSSPAGTALVVVDTGRHVAHTQTLLDFAAARGQPIAIVVNPHWHLDHLGGNASLRQQMPGLKILASDAVAPASPAGSPTAGATCRRCSTAAARTPPPARWIAIDIALIDAGAPAARRGVVGPRTEIDGAGRPPLVGLARDAVTGGDLWVYDAARASSLRATW